MSERPTGEAKLHAEITGLREQLTELRARLREPEEIIRAIRQGEVDAVVVNDRRGDRIYSLRSADLLYRGMVEEMKEGAVALDASGLVVYANAYFARLIQRDRKGLIGSTLAQYLLDESRAFFAELVTAGSQTRRAELVLRAGDGSLVPIHATMNRISLDDGERPLLPDRHRPDGRTPSRAAADREPSQGRIPGDAGARAAQSARADPERRAGHQAAQTADSRVDWAGRRHRAAGQQLSRLIDDLMDVSRVTRGQIRLDAGPVDLVRRSPAASRRRGRDPGTPAGAGVAAAADAVMVHGDPTRLAQVVSNMLNNAAKFTPEGGRISVARERDGAEARIVVRDNGIGIRADMLPRIFDLFTQADSTLERSQGGLGIGLALVRTLVEMHDGRVEARSAGPGQGSEFVVTLPMLAASAKRRRGARPRRRRRGRHRPRRRILVVDDNLDAAESLVAVLDELGHDVRMVTEGSRVVEVARGFQPDAVLLDISLPDVSGYELAAELRSSPTLERVCLVAITGYAQEEHRRRSREVGFDYHCVKPLDFATLYRIIDGLDARP